MRTSSHFTAGPKVRGSGAGFTSRKGARQNDKIAAFMGGNGFGGASSKGVAAHASTAERGRRSSAGGLTLEALKEHDARMAEEGDG